jgi:NAD(P)-dependent dehydrogenase (short-subunit alcohol dehydrogenase family)
MTTLSGKVALVTGGTSGIGKAAAMSPTSRFASTHWL